MEKPLLGSDLPSPLKHARRTGREHSYVGCALNEGPVSTHINAGTDSPELTDMVAKRLSESGTPVYLDHGVPELAYSKWSTRSTLAIPLLSCHGLHYYSRTFKRYEERLTFLPPQFFNHLARNRNPILASESLQSHDL